jgi:nucleoside-diphosphate-sugar epimerase
MKFTILGSSGFIGNHLTALVKKLGFECLTPARDFVISNETFGHVIYCIGLTADFRKKPFETVEAHISLLNQLLKVGNFESLTYLSSTRVYINSVDDEVFENSPIKVNIYDPEELYTLTKLTGERLCLSSGRNTKIARLSNVYGPDYLSENFINSIIKSIKKDGHINFLTTSDSSKDYISINAVADLLIKIALTGKQDIYNVASGQNISNAEIIEFLEKEFSFKYNFDNEVKKIIFPKINIDKIKKEFDFSNDNTKTDLINLIKTYKNDTN